ncbi:MAG: hypothetical protein IKM25_02965 [Clostridia bacterium]|nr:hypothetical protein [Clostridia bacterium]
MNGGFIKTSINLDGINSLDISINEHKKTVLTELVVIGETPLWIYAEKFDEPCNYLKSGIRRGIEYLNAREHSKKSDFL